VARASLVYLLQPGGVGQVNGGYEGEGDSGDELSFI
jgi:hypothetical protein